MIPERFQLSADQYNLLAARRTAFDALLWQTPVLSLTAQAFLFSIALTANNTPCASIIASTLAFIAALASLQLMAKHRMHERIDSSLLESYERKNSLLRIHGKQSAAGSEWYLRWSSYHVWMIALSSFAAASLFVLVGTLLRFEMF